MKNATTEPLALLERVCVMDTLLKHFLPLLSPNFFSRNEVTNWMDGMALFYIRKTQDYRHGLCSVLSRTSSHVQMDIGLLDTGGAITNSRYHHRRRRWL